jgi:hypothetical protein
VLFVAALLARVCAVFLSSSRTMRAVISTLARRARTVLVPESTVVRAGVTGMACAVGPSGVFGAHVVLSVIPPFLVIGIVLAVLVLVAATSVPIVV